MGKMIYCEIFEKKVEKSLEVIKNCVSLQSVWETTMPKASETEQTGRVHWQHWERIRGKDR